MNPIVLSALKAITDRSNSSTGLAHPNDMNAAKDMFRLLHEADEVLLGSEISAWAAMNGWQSEDATELGNLAQQIGMGKKPRIKDGPWWKDGIIEQFRAEIDDSA